MQCPICGSTNNIILENNSQKILKLRHPGLLFSNKELANKFNTEPILIFKAWEESKNVKKRD
jgi:hypothetical protein